jgi:hypothetical protein
VRNRFDFAIIPSPSPVEAVSDVPPQSFNPTVMSRLGERRVVRSPQQLRLHRALEEIGWIGMIDESDEATRQTNAFALEPILITTDGTILAGFGRWQLAVFGGRREISCIECALNEDDSLQFILTHHQIRRGWNDFVRIRLALTMKSSLREKALENMRVGGKYKGLANLPEVQRIDVSQAIANIAGVGARNVRKVETILETAHPRLIEALQSGTLRIDRAMHLSNLPRAEQLEQFIRYSAERATNKVIRRSIPKPKEKEARLDVVLVLDALRCQEARQPGSAAVRVGRHRRTVVLVGQDLMAVLPSQKELHLT